MESGDEKPVSMIPNILLDGDRLNMLLDIICADYITACYASRENGKRVVFKALEKLYISVHVGAPGTSVETRRLRPSQDQKFQERAQIFYDDLMAEFHSRNQSIESSINNHVVSSVRGLEDSVVREIMKPRLLQIVDEVCRERECHLILTGTSAFSTSSTCRATTTHLETGNEQQDIMLLPTTGEIRMEGWLRKKGQHVNLWRERYFMIRSTPDGTHFLCYLRKKGDKEPRGWYVLGPGTTVDEVRESPSKIETKKLFTFRIRHLSHTPNDEVDESANGAEMTPKTTPSRLITELPYSPLDSAAVLHDMDPDLKVNVKRVSSRKFRNRAAAAAAAATAATAVVLTGGLAGVGIGVMGMSMSAAAAASAGAAGAMIAQSRSKGPIALAAESLETAIWWRNSILECIAQAEDQWKRYLNWYMNQDPDMDDTSLNPLLDCRLPITTLNGISRRRSMSLQPFGSAGNLSLHTTNRHRSGSFGSMPRSIAKSFRTSATFSQETSWKLYEFSNKLRVDTERISYQNSLFTFAPPPALRTSLKVHASPRKVFEMLMKVDSSFYKSNHVIQEARVLEEHTKDHSDVVYWKLFPTYLWPFYVSARELCMLRYWRMEPDGSYFICFQSTTHRNCPRKTGTVRASIMGGGFIISPRVQEDYDHHFEECWVTLTIQMNPHGWIDSKLARSWYYVHAYGVFVLEMITAITATAGLHTLRPGTVTSTCQTSLDSQLASINQHKSIEKQYLMLERYRTDLTVQHGLPTKFWSEPNASSFVVRGPNYFSSKNKVPSVRQACRLVSVELYKWIDTIDAPTSAIEDRPFILIINFMLPGPLHHSLVLYFTPEDPSEMKKNSVFADLCHQVLRGSNDEFRTQRIKLIPRVVQGSWPIREGVGTTPAILGTKIYQKYYQGKNYLEVDYDVGSSTVATSVLNLLIGHSRDLIIDLAFVIEAQSVMELPERVLCTVRLDCIDLRHAVPYAMSRYLATKN
ncbi:putative pleckstrin domain, START domain, protein ENHANCED DISEASE RESISTANCE 2 [Plasmopara halstedii]